jgi:adenylate cyclase
MNKHVDSPSGTGDTQGAAPAKRTPTPALAIVPYTTLPDGLLRAEFANCVTLRITDTLKSLDSLRVTAPTSAFNLPSRLPIPEIARRLDVDYVLRGQIVRSEQTLYFTQWLYEASTGALILEHEVVCGLGELEGFERDVLARVAADVRLPLMEHEIDRIMSRRPRNASAYEQTLRAQVELCRLSRADAASAKRRLTSAIERDPTYATAYAWLARYYSIRIGQGWSRDRLADAREARRLAEHAISLDPENAIALATAGHLASYLERDYGTGEKLLRRAVRSCPNEPLCWLLLSATLAYTGRPVEGREAAEYALSLSPLDSHVYFFYNFAAVCCYAQGDYEQAIDYAQRSLSLNPHYSTTLKALIAALVACGRVRKAREFAPRLRRLEPSYTAEVAVRTLPFEDSALREQFVRQLRTGGCFDAPCRSSRRRRA